MFAENIVVSDPQPGRLVLIFQILRGFSDDAPREKSVSCSDSRLARDINVRSNNATCAYFNSLIDYSIGPHADIGLKPRLGMHNCRWMNHNIRSKNSPVLAVKRNRAAVPESRALK